MTFTHALSTNNYGAAKFIVDASAANGTHTTIATALTSASSGDTIFIRPGTYTENLTLKAGVNLASYAADAYTPNVIILGKCTATFAGTCSISGIQLKTNSDFCLAVTGTLATIVNLKGCFIDANNSTAISFTTSSGSAKIQLYDCKGNIDTTGISYFTHSSAGALKFFGGTFENDGASTTAATCSGAGGLNFYNCYFGAPVTTSSTSTISMNNVQFQSALIVNGTGSNFISNSTIVAGSSSAISVGTGATLTLTSSTIDSTNTNAITGAGTLIYAGLSFSNSSSTINTTTKTAAYMNLGKYLASGQPAFFAYLASTALNKTGTGTAYTLGTDALTEVFDQNNNFVTSGTFTAPVTGRYQLSLGAGLIGCTVNSAALITMITSNRSYQTSVQRAGSSVDNFATMSMLVDMDAADTYTATVQGFGEAGNTNDIQGVTAFGTFMSGYLAC